MKEFNESEVETWIKNNIEPRKTINFDFTAHALKEIAERHLGFYISEEFFKICMKRCGHETVGRNYKIKNNIGFCYYKNTNCKIGCKSCVYFNNKKYYGNPKKGNCQKYEKEV